MAQRTSYGNDRAQLQQAFEKVLLKQILVTFRAWFREIETVDLKRLLKTLWAYRNGNLTARSSKNQTVIAGEFTRVFCVSTTASNQLMINQGVSINATMGSRSINANSFNPTTAGLAESINKSGRVITALVCDDLSAPLMLLSGGKSGR